MNRGQLSFTFICPSIKKILFFFVSKDKVAQWEGSKVPFAAGDDHLNKGATDIVKLPIPLMEANTAVPLLSLG